MRRKKPAIAAVIVALAVFLISQATGFVSNTGNTASFQTDTPKMVTRVVDGDTIVVEGGDRVRLLDMDTPEKGEKCYSNATARLKQLIGGKEVTLVRGHGDDTDVYDRLLRYVFYNGTNINLQMVREGYAHLYFYDKNTPYYQQFIAAEQAAKAAHLCVW